MRTLNSLKQIRESLMIGKSEFAKKMSTDTKNDG